MAPDQKHLTRWGAFLLLTLLTLILFFRHITHSATLLSSPSSLASLLASPADQPFLWQCNAWHDLKFRVLFYFIVKTTSSLIKPLDAWTFYWSFVGWSFLFTLGTVFALWKWLDLQQFSVGQRMWGCLLFLCSFPVLFAYDYPVFTREDPLAYLLVTLSLIAALKKQAVSFVIFSTLGALTRETTLVVPICYLLAGPGPLRSRLLSTLPAFTVSLLPRLLFGYLSSHVSLKPIMVNFARPLEVVIFLFLAFGVIWIMALLRWSELRKRCNLSMARHFLLWYTPIAVLLLLCGTILGALARENRIVFLLFPFMIPWTVDWIGVHTEGLRAFACNYLLSLPWMALTLGAGILSQLILSNPEWIGSVLPGSVQARLIGSHTTIATLIASYPEIRWWAFYLVVQCSLVLLVATVSLRRLFSQGSGRAGLSGTV